MKIIVTGASKGIGRALAKLLDKQGHQVLAIARSESALKSLEKEGKQLLTLAADLTGDSFQVKLDQKLHVLGELDILVNNAGQLINKPFVKTTPVEFESQYKSNVITVVRLVQHCLPYLHNGGHIVNISSMGGVQGSSKFPGLSAYSASKGGVNILTECLAEELKEDGIRVNALALGAVQTEMLERAFPGFKAPLSATEMAEYIANFAVNGSRYYNGQVLPVALGNP